VLFASIGAVGLVVHILTLSAVLDWAGVLDFDLAQSIATVLAMASNFILNNEITYRVHRYRGLNLIRGFVAFGLGCSVGRLPTSMSLRGCTRSIRLGGSPDSRARF
jgi:dolichol-phosphate mannosyltransferase